MKWSLKTLLFLLMLVSVFLAWKYNQRNRILSATKKIQDCGGEIYYRWQQPAVRSMFTSVIPYYALRSQAVKFTGGSKSTSFVNVNIGFDVPLEVNVLIAGGKSPDSIWQRLFSNTEVMVDAVRIDESKVDQEFVEALCDLDGLKLIQVERNKQYFQVIASDPVSFQVSEERRAKSLEKLDEPFRAAKQLIHCKLPIEVIDGLSERWPD